MARSGVSRLPPELILRRAHPNIMLRDKEMSATLTGTQLHLYCTEILLLYPRLARGKPWESGEVFPVSGGGMPFGPTGPSRSGAISPA
jgi:hypothetical protein